MSRDRPLERCGECGNVVKLNYIGPEEDPTLTTTATVTTTAAATTYAQAATATAATTETTAETTTAAAVLRGTLAGKVQTDAARHAAVANGGAVALLEDRLGLVNRAEGDVSEALGATALTIQVIST